MGFKDPDRKTPEHDRACIELALNPGRLLTALEIQHDGARALLEQPLQKGDGKYASTVGFIDAIVLAVAKTTRRECTGSHPSWESFRRCDQCVDVPVAYARSALLVEVKTRIDNVGDLLRQINLYREYKRDHERVRIEQFVIWSLAPDREYGQLLKDQGYTLIVGRDLSSLEVSK